MGNKINAPSIQGITGSQGGAGGTGPQGQGLAMRFASAGVPIFIGSRDKNKSQEIVAKLNQKIPAGSFTIEGGTNQEAINKSSEMIIFAVPWEAHNSFLNDLKEQISRLEKGLTMFLTS